MNLPGAFPVWCVLSISGEDQVLESSNLELSHIVDLGVDNDPLDN